MSPGQKQQFQESLSSHKVEAATCCFLSISAKAPLFSQALFWPCVTVQPPPSPLHGSFTTAQYGGKEYI